MLSTYLPLYTLLLTNNVFSIKYKIHVLIIYANIGSFFKLIFMGVEWVELAIIA